MENTKVSSDFFLNYQNLHQVCRVCLNEPKLNEIVTPIFKTDTNPHDISYLIMACAAVEVQ